MNSIIIDGRLTKDLELKTLGNDKSVTTLSIANNEGFGDNKKVCYIEAEVWNKVAENCCKYLKKGSMIAVKGVLALDSWQDKDGNTRSKHKIKFAQVEFKTSKSSEPSTETFPANPGVAEEFNDDEIPF